jgi:hypothetical protein
MIHVPNVDALRAGFHHVEEHLDQWDQDTYLLGDIGPGDQPACGTTACLAGHVLLAAGYPWGYLNRIDMDPRIGGTGGIGGVAMDVLGITDHWDRIEWNCEVWNFCVAQVVMDGDYEFVPLRRSRESLDLLKKRVTEVTGVQL